MADQPINDIDPQETKEWLAAIDDVLEKDGDERVNFLLTQISQRANVSGGRTGVGTTPYINTIPPKINRRIRGILIWNELSVM